MSTSPIEVFASGRRAQLSVEIMALFAFLMLLLFAVMLVSYQDKRDIVQYTGDVYAGNLLERIRMNINSAVIEGNGFSTEFTLPQTLNGADYNVTISGNSVYLYWNGNSRTARVITRNIAGNVTKGVNRLRNDNGVIVLG